MDGAAWERVQAIFLEAAARSDAERQHFLKAACGGDERVMAEVAAMLEAESRGASLLDRGLPDLAQRMVASSSEPVSSQEFGPYRLKSILGEGGMGVVWLAERQDTGTLVAIKFLPHANLSPARRERFACEIKTLARLAHPYIARLYDAGVLADGTPWFVMEYVQGSRLTDYCREHDRPLEDYLRIFRSVCEAVQYAHRQAIVHRDLKPSNILVEIDGTPRLLDFGIARELHGPGENAEHTQVGLRFLSPDYAAPEWIRDGTMGLFTDVYSLGVILYEVLAGRLPSPRGDHFDKPSNAASRFRLSQAAWSDLDALCLKALHPDPQERYPSVEALLRDIHHYLRSEPIEARPPSARYRAAKFLRRNRRALAASSLVAALVLGLTIFFTVRLAKARSTALAEAARTQRVERFLETLFEGGDKDAGPADDLRVATLLDRGLQEAQDLNRDPDVQAALYETVGTIYRKLGKLDRAEVVLGKALERRRALEGPDSPQTAASQLAVALLRADQAKLPEAEQMIRQTLSIEQRHLPPAHPAIVKAMAALGRVLEERGLYDNAVGVLNQALRLQSAGSPTADLAETLDLLADARFYLGDYPAADSLNRRALLILEQLHGPSHPSVADVFVNLGHIQIQLGHYPQAEQDFRKAVDIDRAWYGADHPETAREEGYLAQSLTWQGRFDESQALLRHALAATERAYGKVHPRVALLLSDSGVVAAQRGRLSEAEADFLRMGEIYRAVYGDQHQFTVQAIVGLASIYQKAERFTQAEKLFRQALEVYHAILPAGHVNTAVAEVKLGRSLLSQKRFREAEAHTVAGYQILLKQASPSLNYLQAARADLRKIYEALGQPEKAATFQGESRPGHGSTPP